MAIKSEIGWRRRLEDGTKVNVSGRHFGGEWQFFYQQGRFEKWERVANAPLEDWLELLDAIERMIPRRRHTHAEAERVRKTIHELFPEHELPAD